MLKCTAARPQHVTPTGVGVEWRGIYPARGGGGGHLAHRSAAAVCVYFEPQSTPMEPTGHQRLWMAAAVAEHSGTITVDDLEECHGTCARTEGVG
jgi:hypothetical protein